MVKLIRNTSNAKELDKLSNRKVCNIEEFCMESMLGPIKAWKGSTDEEFFSLLFTNGMLSICIDEREMFLGTEAIGVAMATELKEAIEVAKTDEQKGVELTQQYTSGKSNEDTKNITLDDCLEVLGWELKDGVKIMFDNYLS